jgi:Mn2+/Fe2+ NRAMP family transporter
MLLAQRSDIMGQFVVKPKLRVLGWAATIVMLLAVVAMFATM